MQNVRRIKDMTYIISTEKIKENTSTFKEGLNGDWFYNCIHNSIACLGDITRYDFKIVATNDTSLINSNIQALTIEDLLMLENNVEEVKIIKDSANKYYFSLYESTVIALKAEEILRAPFLKEVDKSSIKVPEYIEIFEKEPHHNHPVIEDVSQILRWKKNPDVCKVLLKLNLNYLIMLLELLGHDKNSEIYRKLYRDIGYSLSGYYEIFYWDINNPLEDEYVAPKSILMGSRHEDRKETQYWIDPNGDEHKFTGDAEDIVSIHYEIASSLFPDTNRPDDILMIKGWILVGSSVYSCPIIHGEPTQGQIDKLYDNGLLNKLCFLKDGFYLNYLKEQDKL